MVKRKSKQSITLSSLIFIVISLLLLLGTAFYLSRPSQSTSKTGTSRPQVVSTTQFSSTPSSGSSVSASGSASDTSSGATEKGKDLPKDAKTSDWNLILVNRDHLTEELNPSLTTVENISVDSRIAENAKSFLAEARTLNGAEHFISGYRSVEYQKALFQSYVDKEKKDRGIDDEAAEEIVKTYSQPAGASEHQTGLAIDMAPVDSLNQTDPSLVEQLRKIAPKYGFVLRFEKDYTDLTGVDYEDWHWRYVGPENAKYMTEHNLSLEAYIDLLTENNRT